MRGKNRKRSEFLGKGNSTYKSLLLEGTQHTESQWGPVCKRDGV